EQVADFRIEALLAQRPGYLLDLLGGGEDVGGRRLGGADDRVEFLGRLAEFSRLLDVRLDRRDLRLGAGYRLRHLDQIEADAVDRLDGALAADRRLQAVDRRE